MMLGITFALCLTLNTRGFTWGVVQASMPMSQNQLTYVTVICLISFILHFHLHIHSFIHSSIHRLKKKKQGGGASLIHRFFPITEVTCGIMT